MKNYPLVLRLSSIVGVLFFLVTPASAMHIMEAYLPPLHALSWGLLALPVLYLGLRSMGKRVKEKPKTLLLLAMAAAFIFLISSLKIPSLSGSCSHMTGTGLAAILFGPFVAAILALVVLVFQALFLSHGGVTTLGANTISMGLIGPLCSFGLYHLARHLRVSRKVSVFIAASVGDLLTYCFTAFQLALAHPSAQGGVLASLGEFLLVFAPTQLPLAIVEGLLTMLIVMGLESYAKPELRELGFLKEGAR